MYELAKYIAEPLSAGDIIKVKDLTGDDTVKCQVIRVEYNYFGVPNQHKILVKAFDGDRNIEYDDVTMQEYFTIVIQVIDD